MFLMHLVLLGENHCWLLDNYWQGSGVLFHWRMVLCSLVLWSVKIWAGINLDNEQIYAFMCIFWLWNYNKHKIVRLLTLVVFSQSSFPHGCILDNSKDASSLCFKAAVFPMQIFKHRHPNDHMSTANVYSVS